MSILEQLLSAIAPHECVGCGMEGSLLCATCTGTLSPPPRRCYMCRRQTLAGHICPACQHESHLLEVFAATTYEGAAKALLHAIKFERAQAGARDAARAMALCMPRGDYIVTHAPTATNRIRTRGYDQAQRIARELAVLIGRPYLPLLVRTTQHRQVGHGRADRRIQMESAFRPLSPVPNRPVLLIDDVLTTGATLEAAALVLQSAGATHVSAAVFACA